MNEIFEMLRNANFINDRDKMQDFLALTKEEFLEFYPYLTEEEYDNTLKIEEILYEV